jgi:hypothetical protein
MVLFQTWHHYKMILSTLVECWVFHKKGTRQRQELHTYCYKILGSGSVIG